MSPDFHFQPSIESIIADCIWFEPLRWKDDDGKPCILVKITGIHEAATQIRAALPIRENDMSEMPPQEQIDIATLWLESNEGEGDEQAACIAVAGWIKDQALQKMLRSEARKAGVTVANLRRKLEARA